MSSSKLLQFFPTPLFLDTPCAGVSISDTHVRMIQFEKDSAGGLKIKKFAEKELPLGAIVAGRLNNRDEIIHTLEALKKETGIHTIRVSIPEEKAYLFETDIAYVTQKEVRNAIEFKLEENVPLPADQILFDYAIVPEEGTVETLRVVVSALPSKFVDIYMDLIHSAGLKAYSLEIESQAIARALLTFPEKQSHLIIQFGTQKASLYIISRGIVRFTSTIHLESDWQTNPHDIVAEARKIMSFWETNTDGVAKESNVLSGVLVCGHGFSESVASEFSSLLNMDVHLGNVWQNVCDIQKVLPNISFIDSLKYASAVGLALPSEFLI